MPLFSVREIHARKYMDESNENKLVEDAVENTTSVRAWKLIDSNQKMLKLCLKFVLVFPLAILSFLFLSTPSYAAYTVDSATLNGSSSVTVAPSSEVNASITVTISSPSNWLSTTWDTGSGANCVDTNDYTSSGQYTEGFTITAPGSLGTYDVVFIAWANNACGGGSSDPSTLAGGIVVAAPTPVPTSTPTPTTATPDPNATATPTPTGTTTTTTFTTVYYPSVILNTYSQDPTGETSLTFSGKSRIEQGTIKGVEYSLDDGSTWSSAQASDGTFDETSEDYTFTATFAEGIHTIKVRAKSAAGVYTQSSSYASDAVTIATTPPKVTLDEFSSNPINNQTPNISGTVTSSFASILSVEVSLDNGQTWLAAKLSGNKFSFTPDKLEDGNYEITTRATDAAGGSTESETKTLIIDTIQPIIGGSMIALGPQVLTPTGDGLFQVVAGAQITIGLSMKGGVIEANVTSEDETFPLAKIAGTNLWSGTLTFDKSGSKLLKVFAVDGAGNKIDRELILLLVEDFGQVVDKNNNNPVSDAEVFVYFFDTTTNSWVLWEGKSYGQENPQKTDATGHYSFMVPSGRYYLEVRAPGYKIMQSEILDLTKSTALNFNFPLDPLIKISFKLPFVGEINITLPSFSPPQTLPNIEAVVAKQTPAIARLTLSAKTQAPDFSLPNINDHMTSPSDNQVPRLLTFIALWSPHSLEQIPILDEVDASLQRPGSITAISLQESLFGTKTFMQRGGYNLEVLVDKNGQSAIDYKVTTLPQHFFIDAKGEIHEVFIGVLSKEQLLSKLGRL